MFCFLFYFILLNCQNIPGMKKKFVVRLIHQDGDEGGTYPVGINQAQAQLQWR
jgi:hypothetical protein